MLVIFKIIKNYYEFLLRKESSINLTNVIEEWLDKDFNNEIAKYFKTSVHVHKKKYEELYNSIADLDNYVTSNLTNNRIYTCS